MQYYIESFNKNIRSSFIGVYDGHSTTIIAEKLSEKLHLYMFDIYKRSGDLLSAIREGTNYSLYFNHYLFK